MSETENPGYAERDDDPTTEQTGGGVEETDEGGAPTTDQGTDAGGRAHTGTDEEHPAGDGPRSDRDVGGPTAA